MIVLAYKKDSAILKTSRTTFSKIGKEAQPPSMKNKGNNK
jgi:hypothetical protein